MGSLITRKDHFHHRSFIHSKDNGLEKTNLPPLRTILDFQQTLERHETYTKFPCRNPGFMKNLKYYLKEDINQNSWRLILYDSARNTHKIKNNDLKAQSLWVSAKQVTAFLDFDN